jgi:hypothetical protein
MLGAEVNSVLYPVERKVEVDSSTDTAVEPSSASPAMPASNGARAEGHLVPGGFKTVVGAGVIGWAIGVVTGRTVGR